MYIVLEGLDFTRKTTLSKALAEKLQCRWMSEPFTENEAGVLVKKLNNSNALPTYYETLMLVASRLNGYKSVVSEYRDIGLVSDRNFVSSMVYQTVGAFTQREVLKLNRQVMELHGHNLFPDQIIFIDIDHETFLERLALSDRTPDEKDVAFKDKAFWEEYRNRYFDALEIVKSLNPKTKIHYVGKDTTVEEILSLIK